MLFLLREPVALLGVAIALLIGVVAHCLAQAAVARAVGDRLPASTGRLSPDPRRHFEPFGVIVMLLAGIGWNKPVPLQEPRFRGGRTRYLLSILVGPLVNLLLGVLGLVALSFGGSEAINPVNPLNIGGSDVARVLLLEFAAVNTALGVLTLIPIPPLDGARILWLYAPQTAGWRNARYQLEERNIGIGICVVLMLPLIAGSGLLMRLVIFISGAFLDPIGQALGIGRLF